MPNEDTVWFEFVESKVFYRRVRELSAEVLSAIQADLIANPERGDLVEGTGGTRKARVADPIGGRGKSGSYRYLYLYLPRAGRIHLLYLYAKGEQANLSPSQKKVVRELVGLIKRGSDDGEGAKD